MRIVFDESTLEQSDNASRSITGVLHFDFNGVYFPSEGWNDFAVVITGWWLDAIESLQRGIEREVVLRFMDGPYWVTLASQEGDVLLLRCIEDRHSAGVVHEEYVRPSEFSEQVRRLAKQVVSACDRGHIASSDVDTLRRYLPN